MDDVKRDNEEVRRPEHDTVLSDIKIEPEEFMTLDLNSTLDSSKDGELNWISDSEWQKWSIGRRLLHRFNFTMKHQWPDPKSWEDMNAEEKRAFKVKRSVWWNKSASNWDWKTKKTAKFWSDKVLYKKEIYRLRKNRFIRRCDPNNYQNPLEEEEKEKKLKLMQLIEEKEELCKKQKTMLEEEERKLKENIKEEIDLKNLDIKELYGKEDTDEEKTMMRLFGEFNQLRNFRAYSRYKNHGRYQEEMDNDYGDEDYEGDMDLDEAEKIAEAARKDFEERKKRGEDPHSSDYDY